MDEAKLADIGNLIMGETPVDLDSTEDNDSTEVEAEAEQEAPEGEIAEDSTQDEGEELEASEGDTEGEGPEYVEIEIDGELVEVDAKYKDYFLRQQDYTTKTQEVAAQRKQVEAIQAQVQLRAKQFEFAESVQPDILKAQQLEATAENYHQYLRDNIESLSSTDIEKIRLTIEDTRRERDKLVEDLKNKQTEFQQSSQQSIEELRNKGTEVLKQRIPGWGEAQQKQVREFALKSGFTEAELSNVLDPRQVETLWKAAQYDALKAGAAPAVKKAQTAPTIKPKARNPMPKETRQKLDLRKKLKSPNLSARDKQQAVIEDIGARWG